MPRCANRKHCTARLSPGDIALNKTTCFACRVLARSAAAIHQNTHKRAVTEDARRQHTAAVVRNGRKSR